MCVVRSNLDWYYTTEQGWLTSCFDHFVMLAFFRWYALRSPVTILLSDACEWFHTVELVTNRDWMCVRLRKISPCLFFLNPHCNV